jgi:enoyl-CoA hydratase/carnithine racemase
MSHIIAETKDRVARIEIARPEKKNALTLEMYAALAAALAAAEASAEVRAILLHGRPDCFCSGNDVKDFLERPPQGEDPPAWRFLRNISSAKKPIVAAVGGPAVGIGTTMLLHCDLIYAAPETRFQLPFVPLGLMPEGASSLLLPMLMGYQRAAELLLLGQPFTADKALAAGLVTEIIPQAELLEYGRDAALGLAALPPQSMRITKRLMKSRYEKAVADTMVEELSVFRERLESPEAKEAFTAFLEKRKPDFSKFS